MGVATKKELKAVGNSILMRKSSWRGLSDRLDFAIDGEKGETVYVLYYPDLISGYYVCPSLDRDSTIGKLPFFLGRKILKERKKQVLASQRDGRIEKVFSALGLGGGTNERKK